MSFAIWIKLMIVFGPLLYLLSGMAGGGVDSLSFSLLKVAAFWVVVGLAVLAAEQPTTA